MYNNHTVFGSVNRDVQFEQSGLVGVTGGIEISLENYSDSRFLLLLLPLPLNAQTDKGLKLWSPAMEQKISLVPAQSHNSTLLKVRMSKIGYILGRNGKTLGAHVIVSVFCFWELWELSF